MTAWQSESEGDHEHREVFTGRQFEQNVPDGIQGHYWHEARNRIIQRTLERIPRARQRTVVEIGCGRGVVVQFLRERRWDVVGCELGTPAPITPEVAPHLHLGVPANALPRPLRVRAGIILLLDVLEHLEKPTEFLRTCLIDFPSCTHFVVTLPARQELYSNYDRHYGHYLRYDRRSLAELCRQAGFAVQHERYFFHALYALVALVTRLGIHRSVEVRAPSGMMRLIHRSIGLCLAGEPFVVPAGVPGTSLIAIIEVPAKQRGSL